jgi:hypothetical protein
MTMPDERMRALRWGHVHRVVPFHDAEKISLDR